MTMYNKEEHSEHYNRRMSEELHDLPNNKKIVDDNIIYSPNSL